LVRFGDRSVFAGRSFTVRRQLVSSSRCLGNLLIFLRLEHLALYLHKTNVNRYQLE
jgi:hypothetical protein